MDRDSPGAAAQPGMPQRSPAASRARAIAFRARCRAKQALKHLALRLWVASAGAALARCRRSLRLYRLRAEVLLRLTWRLWRAVARAARLYRLRAEVGAVVIVASMIHEAQACLGTCG